MYAGVDWARKGWFAVFLTADGGCEGWLTFAKLADEREDGAFVATEKIPREGLSDP